MAVPKLLVDHAPAMKGDQRRGDQHTGGSLHQQACGSLSDLSTASTDTDSERAAPQALRKQPAAWRYCAAMSSAGPYAALAIAMNFINKACLSAFSLANSVLLLQMLAAIAIVPPLRAVGLVQFPALSAQKARHLAPVTILYTANVCFALLGLQNLNIPMYNALKRLTPVMVLGVKASMQRKAPQRDITASVVLIVAGCLIAGLGDFTFDLKGYVCALLSCGLQTGYLLLVERSGAEKGVGTSELLFYNALLSIPFLLTVVVSTGEVVHVVPAALRAVEQLGGLHFAALLGSCAFMGVALNYSLFLCTMHNSALTTTIVGVFKGVLATGLGFFLLGGVEAHFLNVSGILVNMIGGAWYSVIKFRQKAARPDVAVNGVQSASLPQYTAVSAQDEDASPSKPGSRLQHLQPLSRTSSFKGFSPGSQQSPVQSPHAVARAKMRLPTQQQQQQQQQQQREELQLFREPPPPAVLIGSADGGFSPRKQQNPWTGNGAQAPAGAPDLAAGGLVNGAIARSPRVTRRSSVSRDAVFVEEDV